MLKKAHLWLSPLTLLACLIVIACIMNPKVNHTLPCIHPKEIFLSYSCKTVSTNADTYMKAFKPQI
jgi:hypothetical protein